MEFCNHRTSHFSLRSAAIPHFPLPLPHPLLHLRALVWRNEPESCGYPLGSGPQRGLPSFPRPRPLGPLRLFVRRHRVDCSLSFSNSSFRTLSWRFLIAASRARFSIRAPGWVSSGYGGPDFPSPTTIELLTFLPSFRALTITGHTGHFKPSEGVSPGFWGGNAATKGCFGRKPTLPSGRHNQSGFHGTFVPGPPAEYHNGAARPRAGQGIWSPVRARVRRNVNRRDRTGFPDWL